MVSIIVLETTLINQVLLLIMRKINEIFYTNVVDKGTLIHVQLDFCTFVL